MIVGTPDSRALCEQIAEDTDTVIVGFSRGKDSVAAALWLKQFFPKLHLFYCDCCPGIPMVERSIAYYEGVFETKIDCVPASDWFKYVASMQNQPLEDEDDIDAMDLTQYTYAMSDMGVLMRAKYRVPHAWVAWGLSFRDNPIRASFSNVRNGRIEASQTMYPCFDWTKGEVMQCIESCGVKLPEDYHYGNRSFNDIVNPRHFVRLREQSPEDWNAIKFQYPLIESSIARLHFRDLHFAPVPAPEAVSTTQSTSGDQKPVKRKPRAKVVK